MAGGVRKQNKSWFGLWREGGIKKSKLLGSCAEMTKTQARDAVAEIVKRVKQDKDTTLFGAFVKGPYLSFYSRKWKGSTKSKNENRVLVHLVRQFCDCALETFGREQLQDFLDEKAKTLSHSMVTHLRFDLRQIFNMAQAEGLIPRNPAQLLFTPKVAEKNKRRVMTGAQAAACIDALALREFIIVKLAILAGMRPGEIFALRWEDVNFEEGYIEVKRRVYEGVIDTPKSERGFRKVALTDRLIHDLCAWADGGFRTDEYVFPSEVGSALSKNNVWRRNMKPRLEKVGLQWANFQVMRRTFVTLSKLAGGDAKVIADQAGHDIGVSISVYTQSPVASKLKVVNAVEKLILG